jgi:hypothetical protein
MALRRLEPVKRRFLKDQEYGRAYVEFMEGIIAKRYASPVDPQDLDYVSPKWYIPHHGVYHPKKPDKLRVVFDCAARYRGTALNDHLLKGVWERQIRTVRNVLAALMDNAGSQLHDEALRTLLLEVMAIVNSRPLTVDNLYDPHCLEPITPNHILTRKSKIILPPPGNFQEPDLYSRKYWRRVQYLLNIFWCRWKKEYLHNLQKREKWVKPQRNIEIGDIVIVKDDNAPRCQWQLARVDQTLPSKDGLVRKVRLAMGDKSLSKEGKRTHPLTYLERPIQKVILLVENEDQGIPVEEPQ